MSKNSRVASSSGTKGACETVKSVLTAKMRTKRSCQTTNYPFPTDLLIAPRIQGDMFKVRSPIKNFMDKREIVLYRTVVVVKSGFKGSE
jgi:hypothetical protein